MDLETRTDDGLDAREAARRRQRFGANRLPPPPKRSTLRRLFGQLKSPLVLTLIVAAAVSLVVATTTRDGGSIAERYGDAFAIFLIVALNAALGLLQERKAEAALEALDAMTAPKTRVLRDGAVIELHADELVPGDVLVLEAGDAVAADARLVEGIECAADESALTGESVPVVKDAHAELSPDVPLAERATMVFSGTTVVRGRAKAIVTATGSATELGRIGHLIATAQQAPTPLERKLGSFGSRILWICAAASVVLFAIGVARGADAWHVLMLEAVSFAVAAIPEGLPAISTITLALGTQRMARHGVIVRRLPAVETLGGVTVICTDKTGTLTENAMTVREIYLAGRRAHVEGEGYEPTGTIRADVRSLAVARALAESAAVCNTAALRKDERGRTTVLGDPTEGALLVFAAKVSHDLGSASGLERVREIPFDSDRKRMCVVTHDGDVFTSHLKGSPDVLLPMCRFRMAADGTNDPIGDELEKALRETEQMSACGLRVLAVARGRLRDVADDPERDLVFVGLVAMMDPPRAGVTEAVRACEVAGIRPVMITGDHPMTAQAIARELGMWREGDRTVTGSELAQMADEDLRARVAQIRVFARTTAEQKLRIVRALKASGEIVAMTGDGVNDAPALRESHVGIAMGRGGTEVARQAADVVISDDNFATIVEGVREGRAIFANIRKFIVYLLASNVSLAVAVFVVAFASGARWLPLTPLMILCINFVTNGPPALALGVDPPDPAHMSERPSKATEPLLGRSELFAIAGLGGVGGLVALAFYAFPPSQFASDPEWSRAMAFSVLGYAPLALAFGLRSLRTSVLALRPRLTRALLLAVLVSGSVHAFGFTIPALRPVFRVPMIGHTEWLVVLAASLAPLIVLELVKFVAHVIHTPGRALPAR
jgi:Ca2+-transporting ATPase